MSQDNTQHAGGPAAPEGLDQALETTQAAPTVGSGPDSHTLPTTLAKPKPQAEMVSKTQHDGLMSKYQSEKAVWEQQFGQLQATVNSLVESLASQVAGEANAASETPSPPSDPEPTGTPKVDVLDLAIQQRKAASYRDLIVEQMSRELGVPALEMFSDDIPIVPPARAADGTVDDSAQKAAVQAFADKLRGVQTEAGQRTESAIREGMTPGAAPGAATPDAATQIYEEFTDIMQVYGSEEFGNLERAEQTRIEQRYFELLEDPAVQDQHEGETRPTMNWKEMQSTIRDLVKKVGATQGRGSTPFGKMA